MKMKRLNIVIAFLLSISCSTYLVAQESKKEGIRAAGQAVVPAEQAEKGAQNTASAEETGEVSMTDDPRRADEALAMLWTADFRVRSFEEVAVTEYAERAAAVDSPAILDASYRSQDSRSYIQDAGTEISQVHTNTRFGTLIIEEYTDASSYGGAEPNILIDRKPANVVHIEYKEGWATAVYVQHDTSFFVIENDRRIDDKQLPEYLEMVEKLVINAKQKRDQR